jgi:hypothetical protein
MSSKIEISAADLRAEAARYRITATEIAGALNLTQNYVGLILTGKRNAPQRRIQIHEYILNSKNRLDSLCPKDERKSA